MLFDLLVNFWWFYSVINSEYNVDSVHLSWRFRRFDDVTDTSDVTIERHVLLLIKPLCAVARGHFLSRFCPRHISSAKIRYHTLKATLPSQYLHDVPKCLLVKNCPTPPGLPIPVANEIQNAIQYKDRPPDWWCLAHTMASARAWGRSNRLLTTAICNTGVAVVLTRQ